jgi:hypothetical protein
MYDSLGFELGRIKIARISDRGKHHIMTNSFHSSICGVATRNIVWKKNKKTGLLEAGDFYDARTVADVDGEFAGIVNVPIKFEKFCKHCVTQCMVWHTAGDSRPHFMFLDAVL